MSIKTEMDADLGRILASDEFDETAEYYPAGLATHFTVRIVVGDITESAAAFDQGTEGTRTAPAVLSLATVRAGLLALEGAARDPKRRDKIVIPAASNNAGTWYVTAPGSTDVGGGCKVTIERDDLTRVSGTGAVEVR
jgi:hypothetical protein